MTLYHESLESTGPESDRLFQLSMEKFEAAPSFGNAFTLKSWGDALREQSKKKRGVLKTKLVDSASEKYKAIDGASSLSKMAEELAKLTLQFGGEERNRLFKLSEKNFELALSTCKKRDADFLNTCLQYAHSLCLQANLKEKVSILDVAAEKYLLAADMIESDLLHFAKSNFEKRELVNSIACV